MTAELGQVVVRTEDLADRAEAARYLVVAALLREAAREIETAILEGEGRTVARPW